MVSMVGNKVLVLFHKEKELIRLNSHAGLTRVED
jgi:hypothetical protein